MSSVGQEVLWSPVHEDKFVAWGTDIFLYEIGAIKDASAKSSSSYVKTSETSHAILLATNSIHRYVKCIDIYPQADVDILLAVGQANGKVVLTSFGTSSSEAVGREFAPAHSRQCNSVAWNRVDSHIIAVGLEKLRTEPAVLLWDAFRCPHHFNGDSRNEYMKPVFECGVSETANSFAWINASLFAVGLNNKNVKIIDRRDPAKVVNSTTTKAVYGLCVDSPNEQILASFFENQIWVWDVRNFEKPISTMTRLKAVSKISWCPTRHNLLGSLQRDSNIIMLHDLQMATIGNEEVEPTLLERPIQPASGHVNITSFSWHPKVESRLLTISFSGNIIDYYVVERITLNWFPCSHLVWTHGRRTLKVISDRDPLYATFDDISVKIKRRALAKYGLKPELWQNGELAEDESLRNLWHWLYASRSLVEDETIKSPNHYHPGVVSILGLDGSKPRSEWLNVPWSDLNNQTFSKVYKSEERESALQLCGWRFEKDGSALAHYLEKIQSEDCYSRAAAIAVFNLKLRMAINILNRGSTNPGRPNSNLSVVAMALSGFSDDKSSMWRELCVQSRTRLTDPYLQAMFAFLTAENENYDSVLLENGIAVEDRVAFACTFLSDAKLADYLYKLVEKLTDEGDLAGMLLTGATQDGAKLLQRYLDITGDVQSVSLLAVRAFPLEIQKDPNVQNWIASYQQILDAKKLWDQRAHFDLALNTANPCEKLPQQVFLSCNFCGKSISAYLQGINRSRGQFPRVGPNNKVKMSSCPNCRKPLPRCAICLVHMGTPSTGSERGTDNKMADLSSWFTWCQTCRHGGHAGHMTHWFDSHPECPVTGCSCKCMSLDPGSGIH